MNQSLFKSPIYRVLAVLLDYPNEHFSETLDEARVFLESSEGATVEDAQPIIKVIEWLSHQPLLDLQQLYGEIFDFAPDHSLHMTYHLLEEQDRRRGPALIKLAEHYRSGGLQLAHRELPDYLPAILEYASTMEATPAANFLLEADEAVAVLEKNLQSMDTPYLVLVSAIRHQVRVDTTETMAVAGEA